MPTIFTNGGVLFPLMARGAGTFTSDPVSVTSGYRPPIIFLVDSDIDVVLHVDIWIDGAWRLDAVIQLVTLSQMPAFVNLNSKANRFQLRVEAAGASNFAVQMVDNEGSK